MGHSVHLFLTIKPQVLINITLDVFPCSALREEPLFMAYPSQRILPGNQHSLPPGGTSGRMASDHTLFIYKQSGIPKWSLEKESMREGLRHHMRLCCKPFTYKARAVEGNTATNYDSWSQDHPFSLCETSLSFSASRNVKTCSVLHGPIAGA